MSCKKNLLSPKQLYEQGVEKRQRGELGAARNDFKKAWESAPDFCEAKAALDMLDDILRFGNMEQYNV